MLYRFARVAAVLTIGSVMFAACSDDKKSSAPPENTGTSCEVPADCYPNLDGGTLQGGEIQCLREVPGGYCTHLCTTDADCCAVPGECLSGFKQVCAPFQSTGKMMCFLSCEPADVTAGDPNIEGDTAYCQRYGSASFGCRSTGGGSMNRKVCVP